MDHRSVGIESAGANAFKIRSVTVVGGPLFIVAQHIVSFLNSLKFVLGLGSFWFKSG